MSGILGIWNLDGRPVEKALLADMSSTLAHRGADGDGVQTAGPVGLACRLSRVTPEAAAEVQPLVHPSGTALVFDGRLDNREELLASLPPSPDLAPWSPDPALVLAAYDAFGDRFPERLLGDFALGLFDPVRQQLLLARDAIGVRPLYYHRVPDLFLFGSEVKAVLAHPRAPRQPNDDLLADFLLDGAHDTLGQTFFRNIFSLPPAHVATLTPQGFATGRYWDFDPTRRIRLGSFEDYAEGFRHHFDRALRRRLRSAHPVAVSLSGGLDSSSIYCLAETLARRSPGHPPAILGVSYVSPQGSPSDEAAFLLEIEREYGVAIARVPMAPVGPMNGSLEAVWHIEAPFLDEQWNTTHTSLGTARRLGARVILTGHWADQMLFDQAYLIDLFRRLAWREVRAHLREFGRWFTDADPKQFRRQFLTDLVRHHVPETLIPFLRRLRARRDPPCYAETLRKRARERVARRPFNGRASATAHARSLYREARSSHHVQCMEWDNKVAAMHGLEMAFPFLDRDLLSFLMGIPGEMQTWQGVPKALLRAAMRGVLPEAIAHRTWKADFSHLVNEGMVRDFPRLADCLQADGLAVKLGYLRGDVLRGELERLRTRLGGPDCETAWSLSDLLGLELWLRVFLGGNANGHGSSPCPEPSARPAGPGGAA